ncbi:MAG: tyrosine-type recombinase/integrase [Alphaproteobacteria bacterium]|nr:tyrosine-type recombinase/integrase [Alphaproteobacteria bacterium]MDE2492263.1 tyrosine-type recombinase/integrase [Alphaproteobacteria bacterium]
MSGSLFDRSGCRKYLVSQERCAFVVTALRQDELIAAFCLTLAISGARISEVLALMPEHIDHLNGAFVFETLKRRKRGIFRAVPAPDYALKLFSKLQIEPGQRIWPWCRTTAWKIVKSVMRDAGISDALRKPRTLRHTFGVDAGQNRVPLNIVQRWLGHARIETTAIYTDALGDEERKLARRSWDALELAVKQMQQETNSTTRNT